ncbi:MAG: methyltransferase domain-containing protein [Actinomycetota bacterium]
MAEESAEQHEHYDERSIDFLGELWGHGYMSPGGPEEVARVLAGLDLDDARMLDIGCGSGGITVSLARDHGAGEVVGIDVENSVCARAAGVVAAAGLVDRIDIRRVEPGRLPFDADDFDVVFSKDSIVHIPDKEALAADVFRIVRPGGWFAASDWLTSHDGEPSAEMADYLRKEDLGFGMASPDRYRAALEAAGFEDVKLDNRNEWYLGQATDELARLTGPDRARFEALVGETEIASQIDTWEAMLVVLETGEHCPHHFRARKPA